MAKITETNFSRAKEIFDLLNGGIPYEKFLEKISLITPEHIIETAQKYFPDKDKNYSLTISDPIGGEKFE